MNTLETKIVDLYINLLDRIINYYDKGALQMRTPRGQLRDFFRNARLKLENEGVAQIMVVALTADHEVMLLTGSNPQDALVLAEEAARVAKDNLKVILTTEGMTKQ